MKIVVYFETPNNSYAEVVAQFSDPNVYAVCLPVLERFAKQNGFIVTESEREDEFVNDREEV